MIYPESTAVKVSFRCKEEYKKILAGSHCAVHISVGQAYHEGQKFLATMDLINETFASCDIMLCDTLQRHTLKMKNPALSDNDAYNLSKRLGDEWLERNEAAYRRLSIATRLTRWDDWLSHENYAKYASEVADLYSSSSEYSAVLDETMTAYLTRNGLTHSAKAHELCRTYLLEECPVLIPLWAEYQYDFVIYPRARTPAMAATHKHFLQKNHSSLLCEVALKFNQRVKLKPLSFEKTFSPEFEYGLMPKGNRHEQKASY